MWLVFKQKIHEFRNKQNWIVEIWGVLPAKNDAVHTNIKINGPKVA